MIKEDFQKQINLSIGAELALEAIKNGLEIEWETDLEKIDFSIFGYSKNKENLRVEIASLSEFTARLPLFEDQSNEMIHGDDASVAYFAFLVSKGVKVTPPLLVYNWERVDGGQLQRSHIGGNDGNHRTSFCRIIGYESIPMIIEDVFCGYTFTIEKWHFNYGEDMISIIEKNGERKYELKKDEVMCAYALREGKVRIITTYRPLSQSELSEIK